MSINERQRKKNRYIRSQPYYEHRRVIIWDAVYIVIPLIAAIIALLLSIDIIRSVLNLSPSYADTDNTQLAFFDLNSECPGSANFRLAFSTNDLSRDVGEFALGMNIESNQLKCDKFSLSVAIPEDSNFGEQKAGKNADGLSIGFSIKDNYKRLPKFTTFDIPETDYVSEFDGSVYRGIYYHQKMETNPHITIRESVLPINKFLPVFAFKFRIASNFDKLESYGDFELEKRADGTLLDERTVRFGIDVPAASTIHDYSDNLKPVSGEDGIYSYFEGNVIGTRGSEFSFDLRPYDWQNRKDMILIVGSSIIGLSFALFVECFMLIVVLLLRKRRRPL